MTITFKICLFLVILCGVLFLMFIAWASGMANDYVAYHRLPVTIIRYVTMWPFELAKLLVDKWKLLSNKTVQILLPLAIAWPFILTWLLYKVILKVVGFWAK